MQKQNFPALRRSNAHLQLLIAKLERDKHGPSRERTQRLIDQMELQLEELVADATEDELCVRGGLSENTDRSCLHPQAPGAQTLARKY
ncbi:transposase domain-containing protein [Rhizobium beringeri]